MVVTWGFLGPRRRTETVVSVPHRSGVPWRPTDSILQVQMIISSGAVFLAGQSVVRGAAIGHTVLSHLARGCGMGGGWEGTLEHTHRGLEDGVVVDPS